MGTQTPEKESTTAYEEFVKKKKVLSCWLVNVLVPWDWR